jgi:DNA invertase Pin-like site-specific DNA recombinase
MYGMTALTFESFLTYARQSTSKQDENTSEEHQQKACTEFGSRQGWEFHSSIYDNHTGKEYKERKNVQHVLDLVTSGVVKYVVFYSVDRIGRSDLVIKRYLQDIYLAGGKVGIVSKGRWYQTFNAIKKDVLLESVMAEYQADGIKETMITGKFAQFKKGSLIFKPPLGYRNYSSTISGKKFVRSEIVPGEAEVVTTFFNEYLLTRSAMRSAQKINELGLKSRNSARFNLKTAQRLLEYVDRYAGRPFMMEFKNPLTDEIEESEFKFESIISEEVANKVKEFYVTRTRATIKDKPFDKLVFCAECNKPSIVQFDKRKGGSFTHYCRTLKYERGIAALQGNKVDCVCSSSLRVSKIAEGVIKALRNKSDGVIEDNLVNEFDDMGRNYATSNNALEKGKTQVKELVAEKEKLIKAGNNLLLIYTEPDEIETMVKPYILANKVRIKEIDEKLTTLQKRLKSQESDCEKMKRILDYLGVKMTPTQDRSGDYVYSPAGMDSSFALELGEQIQRAVDELVEAIQAERWTDVTSVMVRLGLRVYVDFAEKNADDRAYGVQVRASFDYLDLDPTLVSAVSKKFTPPSRAAWKTRRFSASSLCP